MRCIFDSFTKVHNLGYGTKRMDRNQRAAELNCQVSFSFENVKCAQIHLVNKVGALLH